MATKKKITKFLTCEIIPAPEEGMVGIVVVQLDGSVIGGTIEKDKIIGNLLPVEVLKEEGDAVQINWPICALPEHCPGDQIWVKKELLN
ncbi:MAG: hypothetical protein Q7S73_01780 [bacterium]|nr:hypothetical protein [bacterium]